MALAARAANAEDGEVTGLDGRDARPGSDYASKHLVAYDEVSLPGRSDCPAAGGFLAVGATDTYHDHTQLDLVRLFDSRLRTLNEAQLGCTRDKRNRLHWRASIKLQRGQAASPKVGPTPSQHRRNLSRPCRRPSPAKQATDDISIKERSIGTYCITNNAGESAARCCLLRGAIG